MRSKTIQCTFFVLSILVVGFTVRGYSDEIDPNEKEPAQSKHTQVTASQVTEKKNIKLTDETGTPLEKCQILKSLK